MPREEAKKFLPHTELQLSSEATLLLLHRERKQPLQLWPTAPVYMQSSVCSHEVNLRTDILLYAPFLSLPPGNHAQMPFLKTLLSTCIINSKKHLGTSSPANWEDESLNPFRLSWAQCALMKKAQCLAQGHC